MENKDHLSFKAHTMVADDLAMHGARTQVTNILTWLIQALCIDHKKKRIIKYITDRCICELWPVRGVINFISLDKKGSMIAVRIGVVLVGGCNSLVLLDASPPISRGLARISWDAKGVTGSWYGVWYWVAFPKRKGLTFYVLIFFRGNINMYLYFMSLLHIDMT